MQRIRTGEKVKRLEDESNFLIPYRGQLIIVHFAYMLAVQFI